jgi:glycosyltransferase involved in cell wall biosynthesis
LPVYICPNCRERSIDTDGVEGLMVPPGDIGLLKDAMVRLITDEDLRASAGQRAYQRARNYDVHAYARRLSDYYQRIAPVGEMRSET